MKDRVTMKTKMAVMNIACSYKLDIDELLKDPDFVKLVLTDSSWEILEEYIKKNYMTNRPDLEKYRIKE